VACNNQIETGSLVPFWLLQATGQHGKQP
jgi:hypothetical protein